MASLSVSEPQEMEGELCAIGGPEFRCFTVNSSENDGDIFFASLLCPNSGEFSFIYTRRTNNFPPFIRLTSVLALCDCLRFKHWHH